MENSNHFVQFAVILKIQDFDRDIHSRLQAFGKTIVENQKYLVKLILVPKFWEKKCMANRGKTPTTLYSSQ
jgi:hypothetical protein